MLVLVGANGRDSKYRQGIKSSHWSHLKIIVHVSSDELGEITSVLVQVIEEEIDADKRRI